MKLKPFSITFSQREIDDLRDRLAQIRWPDEVPGSGWDDGVDLRFLQQTCDYWKTEFDWKLQVERLSAFRHYRYERDGGGVHFIHERGKGRSPIPLILTHGWPGSFVEMLRIIPLLTDPAAYGATRPTRSTLSFLPCPVSASPIDRLKAG